MAEEVTCPHCGGKGSLIPVFVRYEPGHAPVVGADPVRLPCSVCLGAKQVSEVRLERLRAGEELKRRRLQKGFGLREFADRLGVLPSVLSQIELGAVELSPELSQHYA